MPPCPKPALAAGALFVAALALMAHARALGSGFLSDDYPLIVQNPLVTESGHWREIFTTDFFRNPERALLYRPLAIASFALNRAACGMGPLGFHAVNLGLHVINALLAGWVVLALFGRPRLALIAASLHAVHPLLAEAVGCVFARTELLCSLGQLAALAAWLRGREAASSGARAAWATAMGVAAAAALLSKESAVCLPGIVLAEGILRRRPWRDVALWIMPAALAAGLYLALRFALFGAVASNPQRPEVFGLINPLSSLPAWHRALAGLHLTVFAVGKFVWPATLSLDYSCNQLPVNLRPGMLLGAGAAVLLWAATLREHLAAPGRRRWPEPVALGLAWFLGTHLLISNIPHAVSTIFAERLLHFPSLGLTMAAAWCGETLWGWLEQRGRGALGAALIAAILLALAARSFRRHADLASYEAAVLATVRDSPNSAKALADAASVHLNQAVNQRDLAAARTARDMLRRSVEIYPWLASHWLKLAGAEAMLGDRTAAHAAAVRALAIPDADERVHDEARELLTRLR